MGTTPDERIADLLAAWEERWEWGEDVRASDLCPADPGLAPELQRRIDALKAMAWMTGEGVERRDEETPPADLMVGRSLAGRYRLDEVVGEGGFGRVYRAFDRELERAVAVKVVRPERVRADGPDGLLDEARRAAKLRHPGIVPVHDVGRDGGQVFVVADYIGGGDLTRLIASRRPSARDAAGLVADVADALQFAHDAGFVHRDIKPANVLLDRAERPLLTDFGLAADAAGLAGGGAAGGTLPYMAPEQVAGEGQLVGPRTDVYALGVVLHELLTGRTPYPARTPAALREQILFCLPSSADAVDAVVPSWLAAACRRCMAKHPSDRFPSAAALAAALRSPPGWWRRMPVRRIGMVSLAAGLFGAGVVVGTTVSSPVGRVRAGPEPATSWEPPVAEAGVLRFDGVSRIRTPLAPFAPCTVEAWVRPGGAGGDQYVVGSDVPGRFGIGLAMNDHGPMAETIRGGFHAERAVPPGRWTHLAAVFGPDRTTLYMDGRRVGVGPPTGPPADRTAFVVGNLGVDHTTMYFRGAVRSVRISPGERYAGDFTPDDRFAPDPADASIRAVLIYDGGAVGGDEVTDLSGAGNHGRWERRTP